MNLCIFMLNFSISFFSQEKKKVDSLGIETLDPVIITATRTVRQLSSIPMPVTLVSKEQIASAGSTRLSDILIEQSDLYLINSDVYDVKKVQHKVELFQTYGKARKGETLDQFIKPTRKKLKPWYQVA